MPTIRKTVPSNLDEIIQTANNGIHNVEKLYCAQPAHYDYHALQLVHDEFVEMSRRSFCNGIHTAHPFDYAAKYEAHVN